MPEKNLNIDAMGGTIAGEASLTIVEYENDDGTIVEREELVTQPKSGKIQELIDYQVTGKEVYGKIIVREVTPFIDSGEANCDTLEAAVYAVRKTLRTYTGNLLICYGTDGAASFTQCLSEGISPDMLGDRSLIVAVAQYAAPKRLPDAKGPIDQGPTDAARNLTHGIYLSDRPEMRGRIGLLVDGVLYPPRGMRKINIESYDPFISRYGTIVTASKGVFYDWGPFSQKSNVDSPGGNADRFKLLPGIESIVLDSFANYENVLGMIDGCIQRGTLNGLVIQAPGSRNVRSNAKDKAILKEAVDLAGQHGIPFAVVSDPMQPLRSANRSNAIYPGHMGLRGGNQIEVDGLQLSEVKVVMSQALYAARKIHKLSTKESIAYVQKRMRAYIRFVRNQINVDQHRESKIATPSDLATMVAS